ncbi:Longin-like domain-containing protein [Apiospora marii]|uniref:Longin-like domain-containing protein n=1 Tax=Apiospora marii TaxID=335849 RepID=A0ABR1RUI2_9PEZI
MLGASLACARQKKKRTTPFTPPSSRPRPTRRRVAWPLRTPLQFSLLLSSTLDIFESRARHAVASNTLLSGDFGLLHAVDDRLAAYGFETNTGIKFVAVVDMRGRILSKSGAGGGVGSPGGSVGGAGTGGAAASGTGPSSVVGATAYVRLLQNPFYDPEEGAKAGQLQQKRITSRRFAEEMRRIGDKWVPGGVNTL